MANEQISTQISAVRSVLSSKILVFLGSFLEGLTPVPAELSQCLFNI